jgi:5-methylcytosine-specific restriction enzyme subunit McrC
MASRTELAALSEGQVLDSVELSRAQASALNSTSLVTVQPAMAGWRVTAAHAVGALRCGDLTVRVQPKIGQAQVLRLLARSYGLSGLKLNEALIGVASEPDLTSVLALLFVQEAAATMAAGPLRGYRTEDQTLNVLRGRLRLRDQELRRFGRLVPLEVNVEEWTTDTDENRRIRAAACRLLTLPGLPTAIQDRLVRLDRTLADVWLPPRGAALIAWAPTRLNLRMHRLLHLADLVLDHASVEHRAGEVEVHGFVLSMSWLFEVLIARLLTESGSSVRVHAQRRYRLDQDGQLTIKPDLVFTAGKRVIAVADTKYKLLDDNGKFPNADAYQLVTYCARLGLDVGHLIYAAGDPCPAPYEILGTDVRLVIHAVDMRLPMAELEERVRELFTFITASVNREDIEFRGHASS